MDIFRRIISKFSHSYLIKKSARRTPVGKVLMFHSIEGSEDEFNISTDEFRQVLERLIGRNVIDLANWESEQNFIALTIDDVPETFYKYAYPLLKEYRMPFTIFVSTSLLDTDGFISTEQLKEMAADPLCTVGSHGHNHSYYYKMTKEEALNDLISSKALLEGLIAKGVTMYAFPYGSYYACGYTNKHLVTEVYKYGFGTICAQITKGVTLPKYFLPRMNVTSSNISELV